MVTVPNQNNLYFARRGRYKGGTYTFSHRDPVTGELWGEDIPVGKAPVEYGKWVPGDAVKLIWDDGVEETADNKPSKRSKKRKAKKGGTNEGN